MAWFKTSKVAKLEEQIAELEEKLNPVQDLISSEYGESIGSQEVVLQNSYTHFYETLEIVNRAVNMVVDDAALIPCTVGDKLENHTAVAHKPVRKVSVERLMNTEPNPFQDISTFKRNLIIDLILDGNIFVYYDGMHMYHLPADNVTINTDKTTYIKSYDYKGLHIYKPNEIIHIKENSFRSIYRGISRLRPAYRTMVLLANLRKFQDNFFTNGAVPGLVLKTENSMSEKIKERLLQSWRLKYRPDAGGRNPMILDGGLEVDKISEISFRDLDFQNGVLETEKVILKALGIPPILFDGGNNANIAPNLKLYYLETVIPIVRKVNAAFSRYFGFEIWEDIVDVPALQPELKEQSSSLTTLVNGGVITVNEARLDLGRDKSDDPEADKLRVPANIAGSAANPSEGGRPPKEEDNGSDAKS